jgi:hypothetical protein
LWYKIVMTPNCTYWLSQSTHTRAHIKAIAPYWYCRSVPVLGMEIIQVQTLLLFGGLFVCGSHFIHIGAHFIILFWNGFNLIPPPLFSLYRFSSHESTQWYQYFVFVASKWNCRYFPFMSLNRDYLSILRSPICRLHPLSFLSSVFTYKYTKAGCNIMKIDTAASRTETEWKTWAYIWR